MISQDIHQKEANSSAAKGHDESFAGEGTVLALYLCWPCTESGVYAKSLFSECSLPT